MPLARVEPIHPGRFASGAAVPKKKPSRTLRTIARSIWDRMRLRIAMWLIPASAALPAAPEGAEGWEVVGASSDEPRNVVTLAASGKAVLELPTRSVADWTPSSVQAALQSADDGMMAQPADLVEALMRDDRVQGVLGTRTFGLLGLPKSFFGSDTQKAKLEGVRDAEGRITAPGAFDRMLPECELAKLLMWGIMLGIGLAELVPQEGREVGEEIAPTIRIWHPRWLRYQWHTDSWHLTTAEGEIEITPGDGRWVMYMPYGKHRPWVYGAWRPCAFAFALKLFALHDRARASEVYGSPVRFGTAPKGEELRAARLAWLRQLKNLGRDTAMVVESGNPGEGYDLKYVEATGQTFKIYDDSVTWADRAIAIALAGQAVTTEGTKGFSNGNIHAAVLEHLIEFTARSLEWCIHEQIFRPLAALNEGANSVSAYVRWDTTPPEDKLTYANALVQLGNAIKGLNAELTVYGRRVDAVAMCHKFGVPLQELGGLSNAPAANDGASSLDAARSAQAQAQAALGNPPLLNEDAA